ncbi:CehA/McbA family metallohydrolase [Aquibacillus kalidii]|uniref:CehA/McbA family metallohydrolase n=1 Tax=Aquibacillus kalidii TaxID=2762597 RepID=UPI0016463731|nr:CehA/McbA family metallohydrolase [Aquibacillus kalidii]
MIKEEKSVSFEINQLHVSHSFTTNISDILQLNLSFSKRAWAFILLWDPNRHLRWQYLYTDENTNKHVVIADDPVVSSFSTVDGPIPSGEWEIEIFCPSYQASPLFTYSVEMNSSLETLTAEQLDIINWSKGSGEVGFTLPEFDKGKVVKTGSAWYKGDFHTHTNQSDGKMTPSKNIEQAKKMGLDFFVATDHNIIPTKWIDDPNMLVIPGVEITSSKGHFNALGVMNWLDWRPSLADGGMESETGINRLLHDVKKSGGLRSINHPMLKPWHWTFTDTLLSEVDTIEIWNDPTFADNIKATEQALILWDTLLNDGHRIFGIGGSDSHLLPEESYMEGGPPSVIGDPCTYVYATHLSAESILRAVSEGKVYVSRSQEIDILIKVNNEIVSLGSEVTAGNVEFCLKFWENQDDLVVEWIVDGEIDKRSPVVGAEPLVESIDLSDRPFSWTRFQVRRVDGELIAFSNPIFKGRKTPSIPTWGNLLQKAGL